MPISLTSRRCARCLMRSDASRSSSQVFIWRDLGGIARMHGMRAESEHALGSVCDAWLVWAPRGPYAPFRALSMLPCAIWLRSVHDSCMYVVLWVVGLRDQLLVGSGLSRLGLTVLRKVRL